MNGFLGDLLASLVGTGVGVWLALWVDRHQERRRAKNQQVSQLRIARWLVEENIELARQALGILGPTASIFFRMNTHLLDSAVVELASLIDDQQLLWRAEHFRYQLHHLNGKLNALAEAQTYQGIPTGRGRDRSSNDRHYGSGDRGSG